LKERPLPKEKSVKDQQEEFQDEHSEMKEAEEEEDSSDGGGRGVEGFIGVSKTAVRETEIISHSYPISFLTRAARAHSGTR
jgi:hypothetical protein